jgi:hypothetical protein
MEKGDIEESVELGGKDELRESDRLLPLFSLKDKVLEFETPKN